MRIRREGKKNDSLPGSLDMRILRTLSQRELHGTALFALFNNHPAMSSSSRRARCAPLFSGWSYTAESTAPGT